MIRPISKPRTFHFVNDFQVFKGGCENTMKTFGQPVAAAHEAELMIRDDKAELEAGTVALYAIHQRSENRIIKIVNAVGQAKVLSGSKTTRSKVVAMPVRRNSPAIPSLPKAA